MNHDKTTLENQLEAARAEVRRLVEVLSVPKLQEEIRDERVALLEKQATAAKKEWQRLTQEIKTLRNPASVPGNRPWTSADQAELLAARQAARKEPTAENRRVVNRLQVRKHRLETPELRNANRRAASTWTPEDEISLHVARQVARNDPTEENRRAVNRLQVRRHRLTKGTYQ